MANPYVSDAATIFGGALFGVMFFVARCYIGAGPRKYPQIGHKERIVTGCMAGAGIVIATKLLNFDMSDISHFYGVNGSIVKKIYPYVRIVLGTYVGIISINEFVQ